MTDYFVILAFIIFFANGWRKGFLRTLLGPIALLIGGLVSYFYYLKTQNIIISLVIGVVAPLFLNIILTIFITLSQSTEKKEDKFSLGRLAGGFLSLFWSGGILLLVIIFFAILPINSQAMINIQKDIRQSKTFSLLNNYNSRSLTEGIGNIEKITQVFQDPERVRKVLDKKEFKSVTTNKKINALMDDEKTLEQINKKNLPELMANPKIQAIMKDPELLKKLLEMNRALISDGLSAGPEKKKHKSSAEPRVIEYK